MSSPANTRSLLRLLTLSLSSYGVKKEGIIPTTKLFQRGRLHATQTITFGNSKGQNKSSEKIHFNVGTIGHVDHGKTTLTSAITKFLALSKGAKFKKYDEIDNAPEERNRGVTINASRLGYETKLRHYAHTDCPGHLDYIKNMITGASQMDAAILVIAADDGVMAQTREHLLLARDMGVRNIVVFINKADLVENDDLELVELETSELLTELGFDKNYVSFIRGSALRALEFDDFGPINLTIQALDSFPEPTRNRDGPFIMPISSVQPIKGRGTVLIGTVESGIVKKGDSLEVIGFEVKSKTTVSDIQIFNQACKSVSSGDHCGILCKGEASRTHRGMWLSSIGAVLTTNVIRVLMCLATPFHYSVTNHIRFWNEKHVGIFSTLAKIYLLDQNESGRVQGIRPGFSNAVFCTTWNCIGRLHFDSDLLMPGENIESWIIFNHMIPIVKHLPLTIREVKKRTIARGLVTELYEPIDMDPKKCFRKFDATNLNDLRII